MHQHAGIGHIIGMVILDLEVVDLDGGFEDFVLDFLNDHIFPVDENQNVSGTEVHRICPALHGRIERMGGSRDDFFSVDNNS